jgi:hypothetical protein
MGSAVDRLLSLVGTDKAFDTLQSELVPLQLDAVNEKFEDRVGKIKLLANRAETGNIRRIRKPADIVPLLFAHTAYKSYPESWLAEGKWERMGKWLETVSAYPVQGLEPSTVKGFDDWMDKLKTVGHYVTCSSGTTGKPAVMTCSKKDLDVSGCISVSALTWALNIKPVAEYKFMGTGGMTMRGARADSTGRALAEAFAAREVHQPAGEAITAGKIAEMIALRRKVADGSATPTEVAEFEKISASRQAAVAAGQAAAVDMFIASRDRKLFMGGMWASLYGLAEGIRAKGYSGKDFNPGNILLVAGGLKRATLPPNYKEYVFETLNLEQKRVFQVYSMQEINSQFPLCTAGRYHIPAWVMLLLLNESGEELLDTSGGGEIEGRAAFFDLSLDARWGGVISGDKIKASFDKCACGHHGPTVGLEIVRYADLTSGDKLACSGTIDAYIRGAV